MADALDYRALFHQLPDSYLLLAPDGTILDNSDIHVIASLLPREQVVGRNLFIAFPADPESQRDLGASHEIVRRTLQPHIMSLLRYDLERPASQGGGTEVRYWQITNYPLLDAQGALQYILLRPQDVTAATLADQASAQAGQALAEANERTRFIVESLPVMVWTASNDGMPNSFNSRWTDYTGRPLADTVGAGWAADLHPDDLPRTVQIWQAARDEQAFYQAEYRLRRHDGVYRWYLAQAVPRLDDDGQVLMWVGCNMDIDNQKQLVAELQAGIEAQATLSDQSYQHLEMAQQQRQTLFNLFMKAPAIIAVLRGAEHRYEFANELFLQFAGQRTVEGRTVAEVFPEIVAQGIVDLLDEVYRTGQPAQGQEVCVETMDGNGQPRTNYFNFVYQRFEEQGQPAGITTYSYDVTELVRTRQALITMGQ